MEKRRSKVGMLPVAAIALVAATSLLWCVPVRAAPLWSLVFGGFTTTPCHDCGPPVGPPFHFWFTFDPASPTCSYTNTEARCVDNIVAAEALVEGRTYVLGRNPPASLDFTSRMMAYSGTEDTLSFDVYMVGAVDGLHPTMMTIQFEDWSGSSLDEPVRFPTSSPLAHWPSYAGRFRPRYLSAAEYDPVGIEGILLPQPAIPEPSTQALVLAGMLLIGLASLRCGRAV